VKHNLNSIEQPRVSNSNQPVSQSRTPDKLTNNTSVAANECHKPPQTLDHKEAVRQAMLRTG